MNEVERVYQELLDLRNIVAKAESPSDQIAFGTFAAKTLLLASASYFERQICENIANAARGAGTSDVLVQFIVKQGLERKYSALFNWKQNNINGFLAIFGDEAKKLMEGEIKADDSLKQATKDFLFIGSQRNDLVHNNFASFGLNYDMMEIWQKHQSASKFSEWFSECLSKLCAAASSKDG